MKRIGFALVAAMALIISIVSCGGRVPTPVKPSVTPVTPTDPIPSLPPDPNGTSPVSDNSIDMKILTLNCWGLPNPITKDLVPRFEKISTAINGYDIVNLQETFSDYSKTIIFAKADYPNKFHMDNSSFLTISSGLGSLSKYPIKSKKFQQYTSCSGVDCFSNKGILFVRLNVPQLGDVDIYNTHAQSVVEKEDVRLADNKDLARFVKANDVGNLTILTGDFNYPVFDATDSSSKAFTDLKKLLNPVDTFRVANPGVVGFTSDGTINKYANSKEKPQRLDYIFVLPENRGLNSDAINYKVEVLNSKVVFDKPVDGLFLSDHFGVATTLRIHLK